MKHFLVVFLVVSVLSGSVWPAGSVSAQEPTSGGADESQYSSPPPVQPPGEEEVPQAEEEMAPAENQYAQVPPEPSALAPQQDAPTTEPVTEDVPAPKEDAPATEQEDPSTEQYTLDAGSGQTSPSEGSTVVPVPTDEPLASGVAPDEPPPAGGALRGEDEDNIRPTSHCGDGLFGPGPPEGEPCPGSSGSPLPQPEDDPYQYQYTPSPQPPVDSTPTPSEPQPSPGATPPSEAAPVEETPDDEPMPPAQATATDDPQPDGSAPEDPAPAPEPEPSTSNDTPAGGSRPCDDDGQTCGLDVPEGYVCEEFHEGGSQSEGAPLFYTCEDAEYSGDGPGAIEGPAGENCRETLIYDSSGGAPTEGYDCTAKNTGCVYDASWNELGCSTEEGDGPIVSDQIECGEDDCGLKVPPRYDCYRYDGFDEYLCYDPDNVSATSPTGAECVREIFFSAPDSPGEVRYKCDEDDLNRDDPYCGYYDENWAPIECSPGAGGGVDAAQENSDEAVEVVSHGRDPSAPGNGSGSSGSNGGSGSGGLIGLLVGDDSTGAQGSQEPGPGDVSGSAPNDGPGEDEGGAGAREYSAPAYGGMGPAASPVEAAMLAVLGDTSTAKTSSPGRVLADASEAAESEPEGDEVASRRTNMGVAVLPAPRAALRAGSQDADSKGPEEEQTPLLSFPGAFGAGSNLLVDDNPRSADVRDYGFVDQEAIRRVAFIKSPDADAASRETATSGQVPSRDRPQDGGSRNAASPDEPFSLAALSVALLAAVGTVLIVRDTKLRGARR